VPETFDLQHRLDELVRDVSRVAGPGDAGLPVRRARRRRVLAGAVAAVLVVTLGTTVTQVVGGDAPDSAPDIADRGRTSPGLERRERLLGLLPASSRQVSLLDVEGFRGRTGLSLADPEDQEVVNYVMSSFLRLQRGPFERLLLPDLVTYAGSGATDVFLVDRDASEVTRGMVRAGWEDDDGVLVPGGRVSRLTASLARFVLIADEGGRTVVVLARERRDLPDLRGPTPEPVPAAAPLVTLGGAVGVSLDVVSSCTMQAVTLSSRTTGLVLLGPPEGTAPEDVTVGDLEVPEGLSSIEAVSAEGDSVVAQVTVPGPEGPQVLLRRLGLPGTGFC